MDPEKILAIESWLVPKNKKQIRSLLEFCSYRLSKDFLRKLNPCLN